MQLPGWFPVEHCPPHIVVIVPQVGEKGKCKITVLAPTVTRVHDAIQSDSKMGTTDFTWKTM
jgi:hypothetical protein